MGGHNLAVLRIGMREDVLDEIVAILVAGNVYEGDARTIHAALANSIQVAA